MHFINNRDINFYILIQLFLKEGILIQVFYFLFFEWEYLFKLMESNCEFSPFSKYNKLILV